MQNFQFKELFEIANKNMSRFLTKMLGKNVIAELVSGSKVVGKLAFTAEDCVVIVDATINDQQFPAVLIQKHAISFITMKS